MKQCPDCQSVWNLRDDEFPFHCTCRKRFASPADMPGAVADAKPTKRTQTQEEKLLRLLPEPDKIKAEAKSRGMLVGDVIAAMTKAVGIPPCGGCESRRVWLNKAHEWVRGWFAQPSSS